MSVILHLGLGAFHRAHQADFTQDAGGWRIEPVAMRNASLAQALNAQGGQFTLIEQHESGPVAKPHGWMGVTTTTTKWRLRRMTTARPPR